MAKEILRKTRPFLNFYVLVGGFAVVWMLFFDQNNIIDRLERGKRIRQVEADLAFYTSETQRTRETRYMLESDAAELERFARERYRMKREDEDLFVLIDPEKK